MQPPVRRARTVLTVHDLAFARNPHWHGEQADELVARTRTAVAAADALIVPSQTTAADLRSFAPTAPTPHVIPFGSDHVPAIAASHAAERPPYVLCLGTIEPRKNHLALLAAWRQLPAPRPRLLVVGHIGWDCDAIVKELERAVADGLVAWRRSVRDDELWPLLANAELMVYPSPVGGLRLSAARSDGARRANRGARHRSAARTR